MRGRGSQHRVNETLGTDTVDFSVPRNGSTAALPLRQLALEQERHHTLTVRRPFLPDRGRR